MSSLSHSAPIAKNCGAILAPSQCTCGVRVRPYVCVNSHTPTYGLQDFLSPHFSHASHLVPCSYTCVGEYRWGTLLQFPWAICHLGWGRNLLVCVSSAFWHLFGPAPSLGILLQGRQRVSQKCNGHIYRSPLSQSKIWDPWSSIPLITNLEPLAGLQSCVFGVG